MVETMVSELLILLCGTVEWFNYKSKLTKSRQQYKPDLTGLPVRSKPVILLRDIPLVDVEEGCNPG
jgi:hypothetical protein